MQKYIIFIMRMEEKLTPIKIKTWEYQNVCGCLYEEVGGKQVHLGTSAPIRDIVFWQGKRKVVHWELFPVGGKCEPWVIALDVIPPSGYVMRCILNKY